MGASNAASRRSGYAIKPLWAAAPCAEAAHATLTERPYRALALKGARKERVEVGGERALRDIIRNRKDEDLAKHVGAQHSTAQVWRLSRQGTGAASSQTTVIDRCRRCAGRNRDYVKRTLVQAVIKPHHLLHMKYHVGIIR